MIDQLWQQITFTDFDTDTQVTATIIGVTAAEVGPQTFGYFYLVETSNQVRYEVDAASNVGTKIPLGDLRK